MDYKKDRRVRSIYLRVGFNKFLRNEEAETAKLVTELTEVALVVALVLIPIGLYYLNNANLSGMPAQQVLAIGSIAIIIVVAVLLAILRKAMRK